MEACAARPEPAEKGDGRPLEAGSPACEIATGSMRIGREAEHGVDRDLAN